MEKQTDDIFLTKQRERQRLTTLRFGVGEACATGYLHFQVPSTLQRWDSNPQSHSRNPLYSRLSLSSPPKSILNHLTLVFLTQTEKNTNFPPVFSLKPNMGLSLYLLSFILALHLNYPQALSSNPELRVLMAMKASLDPENRFLSSWTSDNDPCSDSFEGVACNEYGHVVNISLQGKGLMGQIPKEIAELKSLSGLFLHFNSLYGEIPKEISALAELSDLYLNVNNLSGVIHPGIGNMSNLQGGLWILVENSLP